MDIITFGFIFVKNSNIKKIILTFGIVIIPILLYLNKKSIYFSQTMLIIENIITN